MRFITCYAVLVFALLPLTGRSEPNPADTCLLSQPAVSKHHIAFIYAEDLWIADLDGRNPRRLTSDLGLESNPVFSPDGQTLAFSAQYDGNTDVYAISITGGMPKRLTWHPGPDIVRGFTPDGKILFNSSRNVFSGRYMHLFTVSLAGGMPDQLPIPHGFEASFSPDAAYIAYCPHRDVTAQWKHYRGGTHSRIWIYNRQNHAVVEIAQPEGRCNDLDPVWIDGTIFFRSDRNGEYNVFAYDVSNKKMRQITYHTDFPVVDLAGGAGNLVYEQAGYLHRLDPAATGQSHRIKVGIAIDLVDARPRYAKGARYLRSGSVSPKGIRAVFEYRGEIVTVPAEKGDPRNLTNTTGVFERSPVWSPDGKTIAYFSEASGEYELFLSPQNGKGPVKKIHLNGAGFYRNLAWSPDSTKVLFSDNSQMLYYLDVASGKQTKIDEARYGWSSGNNKTCCWSHDSKWVTYAKNSPSQISRIYVYSLDQGKSFAITDGLTEAADPVFDASGKYLYFISSNDTGMSKHGFMMSAAESQRPRYSLNLVVLRKDLPSPFLRESDEETSEPEKKDGSDAKSAAGADDSEKASGKPKKEPKDKKAKEPLRIDFADIDQRILALPLPSGSYNNLQTGQPNQLFYMGPTSGGGSSPGGTALQRYDVQKRKSEVIRTKASSYLLTPDGKKMMYSSGGGWMIGSTTPSPSGSGDKALKVNAIEVRVEPLEEWKQILTEAWRINRDFFYAPNMHGADWQAIRKKYDSFLPHLTSNADLYRVIRWMLSELAVGHSYTSPGERNHQQKTVPGGLLGADYEIANGRYRFKKIYGGLNWTSGFRSPLTAPGINVKEGEYLLAVRGIDLKAPTELYSVFENTAGKSIEITVGPKPDGKDSRTVTVEPLSSEYALRNRDWVEGNLKKVHQATNGRVAYVYVPDTGMGGLMAFKRYFYPQIDKEAVILDERFNGGGVIADYYIDLLRKPFLSYFAPRYGEDWLTPSAAIHGPKVMLINEGAGSGGDMLPWMFRETKLGPLVGKRTWGGLVGIGGYPELLDGGRVTAPSIAFWSPKTGWSIENEGVAPDIEVEQWPADVIAGRDPQLEKAISIVMEELKKNPPKKDIRPDYPIRVKK